ncbi:MAG: glycosyltransferase family 25 protein [Luteolibacter sp.]
MRLLDHFERLYVISLPYKADRRERLAGHLEELGLGTRKDITWAKAISGEHCQPPVWFGAGNGAWGCLQSHARIVEDAIMDEITSYCVLEDDAVFCDRAEHLLKLLMEEMPDDWGQIYLGGQHIENPGLLTGKSVVARGTSINRTHAFAVHKRAFQKFYRHILDAPEYISRGSWHIDHQLGLAHEARFWNTYVPLWWIAGQDAGFSSITCRQNPRYWWHSKIHASNLPFIRKDPGASENAENLKDYVHFGYDSTVSNSLDTDWASCAGSAELLSNRLLNIAREALEIGLLPGINHPAISSELVEKHWAAGVISASTADLPHLVDYAFGNLPCSSHKVPSSSL